MGLLQIFLRGDPMTGVHVESADQFEAMLQRFRTYAEIADVATDLLAREAVHDTDETGFDAFQPTRRDVQRLGMIWHALHNAGADLKTLKREIVESDVALDLRPNLRDRSVAVTRVKAFRQVELRARANAKSVWQKSNARRLYPSFEAVKPAGSFRKMKSPRRPH
jgi:hypothetical protein